MNLPTSVIITGCDSMPILQQALQAARSFQPMDSSQVAGLLAKTSKAAVERRSPLSISFLDSAKFPKEAGFRCGPQYKWGKTTRSARGARGQDIGSIHIASDANNYLDEYGRTPSDLLVTLLVFTNRTRSKVIKV
jgi:hypothetical protein